MANNKKLYVGNIPHALRDHDLEELFKPYGAVDSAVVIMDRDNPNRSKGFGFVEFSSNEDAQKAIEGLHETEVEGRNIIVNEARPKTDRGDRGGDRGNRGGFGSRR